MRIRAIQLDLARQRETPAAIAAFARTAADHGFNTLLLYLEGVVRTPSFPHRPPGLTYSPAEARRIARAARDAGLEVVPCVSVLGHVEHFTETAALRSLAEDRHRAPHMFCPSNPRVFAFLEKYLVEIAALFPGEHFHIGCDESWGLGLCPRCRGKSSEDLLIPHVARARELLRPLGRRVWMWDDMLENAEERVIARLPRDVVLCAWNYAAELVSPSGVQGHFNNRRRRDLLGLYERLGFDAIFCPRGNELHNIRAFTDYARRRRVLGGLLTNWEMTTSFLPSVVPGLAYAGALWSKSTSRRDPLAELLPGLDARERAAVRAGLTTPLWPAPVGPSAFLRGELTADEQRHLDSRHLLAETLAPAHARLPKGAEREIVGEILAQARLQVLAGRQRAAAPAAMDPRGRGSRGELLALAREYDAMARSRAADWRRLRPGLKPDMLAPALRACARGLRALRRPAALLELRLFLTDCFGAPRMRIELARGGRWRLAAEGSWKPVNDRDAQYTVQLPIAWRGAPPDRMRVTVSGYGGQGIAHAALHFAGRSLTPRRARAVAGRVENPGAVLRDDALVCRMGSEDVVATLRGHTSNERAVLEIALH